MKHCTERYGKKEVESWWWEVWNEPNIGYWQGTREEYFKLYDFAADAVKRACPNARIGAPTTTSSRDENANNFLRAFLQHCADSTNYATGQKGSPLDYISFHAKELLVENDNAFSSEHLRTTGVHDSVADVSARATTSEKSVYILLWNYYDDDTLAPDATVKLQLNNIPGRKVIVNEYRIDEEHSNSYTAWKKIGSP